MSKYHDDSTRASDSLRISVSHAKLRRLHPELYGWRAWFFRIGWGAQKLNAREAKAMLSEHMSFGDTRAALVVQTSPRLLVAAYTDEQDAVLLLHYPGFLVTEYGLEPWSRLLTVNTYGRGKKVVPDIAPGPKSIGRWANCYPIIAEFVSDDLQVIADRKRSIDESEWARAARFAAARISAPQAPVRNGQPLWSQRPGKPSRIR